MSGCGRSGSSKRSDREPTRSDARSYARAAEGVRSFDERVHALIARIPEGRVVTYRDLAHALGMRGYRAIGGACNRSPGMPNVPCHRVVASDGRLHGFASGLAKKRRLLESEGVAISGSGAAMRVDLERYRDPDALR